MLELATILELPFVFKKVNNNCPLLKCGYKLTETIYRHRLDDDETIPQFLKRIYGDRNYEMDSSLFMQIIHYEKDRSDLVLMLDTSSKVFTKRLPRKVCRLSPVHSTSYCDTWLTDLGYNDRSRDDYLGLTINGPLILSGAEWAWRLYNELSEPLADKWLISHKCGYKRALTINSESLPIIKVTKEKSSTKSDSHTTITFKKEKRAYSHPTVTPTLTSTRFVVSSPVPESPSAINYT